MQTLKPEKDAAIIQAAAAEFRRVGYAGASMRRIAKAADMTVGNIYRYYEDKNAVFDAVFAAANKRFGLILRAARFLDDPEHRLEFLHRLEDGDLAVFGG